MQKTPKAVREGVFGVDVVLSFCGECFRDV